MTRLAEVHTNNILDPIALGCQTMDRVFNRDDNNIPLFASRARPGDWLHFNPLFSEAHVPGRHLNTL